MAQLFQNIKYYVVGNLKDEDIIDDLLESRGAKKYSYLTGQVSLVIAETPEINEEDPPEIEEARDIHETSCVTPDWVRLSVTCDQLLPQKLFYPERKLFTDKIFIVDLEKSPQYDMSDIDVLWTLITTNGGHILNLKVFSNPEIKNMTKYMEEIKEKDFYLITDTNFETIENWIETLSEGTKLNEMSQFLTTLNFTFITPDWITDSIELSTLVADTLKYHPKYLNSTCPTPNVDAILSVSSAALVTMVNSLPTEPMETNSDKTTADNLIPKSPFQSTTIINLALYGHWNIDYVPSTSLENTCVDEKLVPSNLCLLGCIFYIDDYAETIPVHLLKSWKKVITLHGGKIVLEFVDITGNDDIDLNHSKITHFLTSSQTELWQKAHKAGKRCITAHWLNDVISRCNTKNSKTSTIASDLNAKNENVKSDDSETRKKISLKKIPEILAGPPWKILHFPMPTLPSNITHFMESQIISITQFDGEEREQLKLMIWRAGAKYSGTLNRNVTTILIAKSNAEIDIESEKIEKALEWNIPIVTSQWLIDCLTLQMFQANISPLSEELEHKENDEINILNKTLFLNNDINGNLENSDINIKYRAVKMGSQTPFFLREKTVKNDSKVELSSKFPYTYMYDNIEQNSNAEHFPDINGLGSDNPKTRYKPLFLEYWNEVPKLLEPWKKPLTLSNTTIQEAIKIHDTLTKTNDLKQLSSEKRNGGKKRSYDQITTESDNKNGHHLSSLESKFSNNVTQQTPEIVDLSTAPDINSQAWEMANKKRLIQVAAMLSKRISLSSNTIIPLNNANNVEIFDHSSPKNTLSANIGGKLNGCCKISPNKYIRIMFTGQTKSKLMDLQKKTQELITRLNNQLINTGQSPHHHHASPLKSPIELSSYESNISFHNIEITENPMLATHLILERPLRRTLKLLFVLGAGTSHSKYPLTPDWIVESARMAKILDESDYLFHDECAEQEFDFCLKTALYRSQHRGPLFKNISFYITPNVDPNVKLLKHIIEVSGGVFVKQRPSIRQINMQNKDKSKFLIISCPKDVPSCKDFISQDINLYHVELILTSLMRQTINYEQFILDPEGES